MLLASVPAAIGLAMVADDLIPALYDPQYDPSIVLIQILAGHVPLAAMDTVLAVALIASNRQSRYLWVSVGAAVFNPIACVVLIHWANDRYGNGAIGAAIVTVATELIVMVGAIVLRVPGVLDRADGVAVRPHRGGGAPDRADAPRRGRPGAAGAGTLGGRVLRRRPAPLPVRHHR